jgi:hypothetical protein
MPLYVTHTYTHAHARTFHSLNVLKQRMTRREAYQRGLRIADPRIDFEYLYMWWCIQLAECLSSTAYVWNERADVDEVYRIRNNEHALSHSVSLCVHVSLSLTHTFEHSHTQIYSLSPSSPPLSLTHTHTQHSKRVNLSLFLSFICFLLGTNASRGIYFPYPCNWSPRAWPYIHTYIHNFIHLTCLFFRSNQYYNLGKLHHSRGDPTSPPHQEDCKNQDPPNDSRYQQRKTCVGTRQGRRQRFG